MQQSADAGWLRRWGLAHNMRIRKLILRALEEDIGSGDVTSRSVLSGKERGTARVIAKGGLIVAGMDVFRDVFLVRDDNLVFTAMAADGDSVAEGSDLARIAGSTKSILEAERTALNLFQRMCGIATLTARFAEEVKGTGVSILDTRKTMPGLRVLDKYAVRVGGGINHRFGLDSGVLLKENHIFAAGGIAEAIRRVRNTAPPSFKIEVEVRSLAEVREALESGAHIIMLDNMDNKTMAEAVGIIGGKAIVEASGNATLANVAGMARTGVDFISVGSLTHSVHAADISLILEQ
ncbi:MAG: carboxylating nicotinate-nucleotide diphosphorylase [Syntrophales bacterium]|nr:carboxylating nicotinate-nucleotide diphosphorylase [Syntrophales bacterium]